MVVLLSIWDFPFTQSDLRYRYFVKFYLDKKGLWQLAEQ
jgi:hypothetical protein